MATIIDNNIGHVLLGGIFDDFIDGNGGADNISGSSGDDTLEGGSGNDVILGGRGGDIIRGEGDNDDLDGDQGPDTIDGGPGIDTLFFNDGILDIFVDLEGGGIGGDAGGDVYSNIENFDSDQYNGKVQVFGTDQANSFRTGPKDDVIFGRGGNDTFFGSAGADKFHGGTGDDTVDYSTATSGVSIDLQFGNLGQGGAAGDEFFDIENARGSAFADFLRGNEDVNVLEGRGGGDRLEGRLDSDIYIEATPDGARDEIFDQGGTLDRLEMRLDDIVTIQRVGNDLRIFGEDAEEVRVVDHFVGGRAVERFFDLGGDIGEVVLSVDLVGGDLPGIISGTDDGETMDGRGGNDVLYANGGRDWVIGGDGDDRLYGQRGNDTVEGGEGDDSIWGGDGKDTIVGGAGADELSGGKGRDSFKYAAADESPQGDGDTIIDFRPGQDTIDFSDLPGRLKFIDDHHFTRAGQVRVADCGDDTLVQVNLDGNRHTVELEIRLEGNLHIDEGDFLL